MKKQVLIFTVLISALTLISCASTKEIPTNLTSAQLIQNAQNAYEKADYKNALRGYETLIQRYGTDLSVYVEARYEIGHIYLKTKKYDKAYDIFTEINGIYEDSGYGDLPTAYKKLAQIGMSQIPEKKLAAIQEAKQAEAAKAAAAEALDSAETESADASEQTSDEDEVTDVE